MCEVVVAGQIDRLAAFLVQAHPQAAVLDIHVLDPHGGRRADAGEGVDPQPDQRPFVKNLYLSQEC